MAIDERLDTDAWEGCTRKNSPSLTSFIPNNYSLPGLKIHRPFVKSKDVVLSSDSLATKNPNSPLILPELLIPASEVRVKEGQVHFGNKTTKYLNRKLLSHRHRPKTLIEILNEREEKKDDPYPLPALDPLIIEQDLHKDLEPIPRGLPIAQSIIKMGKRGLEIQERKGSIKQPRSLNNVNFIYTHVKDDAYPRQDTETETERLQIIPMFQFPERIAKYSDISMKGNNMVLSKELSEHYLKHCALWIDHNDYLLKNYNNFINYPHEGHTLLGVGDTSKDVVMNHLNYGRWIWITQSGDASRREIMLGRTGDFYDARLMYILGKDREQVPGRLRPLIEVLRCRGRALKNWERKNFHSESNFESHLTLIGNGKLSQWVHDRKLYDGPLVWMNVDQHNQVAWYTLPENHKFHSFWTGPEKFPRKPMYSRASGDSGYHSLQTNESFEEPAFLGQSPADEFQPDIQGAANLDCAPFTSCRNNGNSPERFTTWTQPDWYYPSSKLPSVIEDSPHQDDFNTEDESPPNIQDSANFITFTPCRNNDVGINLDMNKPTNGEMPTSTEYPPHQDVINSKKGKMPASTEDSLYDEYDDDSDLEEEEEASRDFRDSPYKHIATCDKKKEEGVPGMICECPGPSRAAGELDEAAFEARREKFSGPAADRERIRIFKQAHFEQVRRQEAHREQVRCRQARREKARRKQARRQACREFLVLGRIRAVVGKNLSNVRLLSLEQISRTKFTSGVGDKRGFFVVEVRSSDIGRGIF